jgi:hypothetical protein
MYLQLTTLFCLSTDSQQDFCFPQLSVVTPKCMLLFYLLQVIKLTLRRILQATSATDFYTKWYPLQSYQQLIFKICSKVVFVNIIRNNIFLTISPNLCLMKLDINSGPDDNKNTYKDLDLKANIFNNTSSY